MASGLFCSEIFPKTVRCELSEDLARCLTVNHGSPGRARSDTRQTFILKILSSLHQNFTSILSFFPFISSHGSHITSKYHIGEAFPVACCSSSLLHTVDALLYSASRHLSDRKVSSRVCTVEKIPEFPLINHG